MLLKCSFGMTRTSKTCQNKTEYIHSLLSLPLRPQPLYQSQLAVAS